MKPLGGRVGDIWRTGIGHPFNNAQTPFSPVSLFSGGRGGRGGRFPENQRRELPPTTGDRGRHMVGGPSPPSPTVPSANALFSMPILV